MPFPRRPHLARNPRRATLNARRLLWAWLDRRPRAGRKPTWLSCRRLAPDPRDLNDYMFSAYRLARTCAGVDERDRLLLPTADGIPGVSTALTEEADPTRARRQKTKSAREMGAAGTADGWLGMVSLTGRNRSSRRPFVPRQADAQAVIRSLELHPPASQLR
jgi:hypothetical protein